MSYKCFDVTIADGVAHILMNRPDKRNAMIAEFWTELPEIVRDIDDNARARCIVLSSTGPVFCAGIDVGMFQTDIAGPGDKNDPQYGANFLMTVKRLQAALSCLEDCRIPVIAAIQGGCYGGGVDLITACDMRYGTEDSFITIYEINVGMTADVGTFPRILNHMPEGVVRELAYTGRKAPAAELHQRGLYNETFADHAAMMDHVMAVAREIATKPPLAVYGCKRTITYGRDHTTADALDNIAVWNMSMLIPTEMMEAMVAMGAKRPAKYADLPKRNAAS